MSDLTTITPAETFRAKASGLMVEAANMTLHQLVDEFMRLSGVMDENCIHEDDSHASYLRLNERGEVAERERKVIVAASRARFGITLEAFDRNSARTGGDW